MKKLIATIAIIIISLNVNAAHCAAKKADGQPCKAYAMKGDQMCRMHSPKVPTCKAKTKAGNACKLKSGKTGLCHIHSQP